MGTLPWWLKFLTAFANVLPFKCVTPRILTIKLLGNLKEIRHILWKLYSKNIEIGGEDCNKRGALWSLIDTSTARLTKEPLKLGCDIVMFHRIFFTLGNSKSGLRDAE